MKYLHFNVPGTSTRNWVISLLADSEQTVFVLILKVVLDVSEWHDMTKL
jgi:hypothetical protein